MDEPVNPNFYERNLASLRARYPEYASALFSAPLAPVRPVVNASQLEAWAHQAVERKRKQLILLGSAWGQAVLALRREHPFHLLVIVESHVSNLAEAMQALDLTEALEDECVHWLVGCSPAQLHTALRPVQSRLAAHGFQVLKCPFLLPGENRYYDAVLREIPGIMERETFSLRALLARGIGVQSNLALNFPTILDSTPAGLLAHRFRGIPAIVVAAGPSLDRNVQHLASLGDRALILCVDTALRTLLPQGIHPHIAVTADPTRENARHFDEVDLADETTLAYVSDCCPAILEKYRSLPHKICLFDDNNWFNYDVNRWLEGGALLPRSMHVGETAIRLAIALGCDPIIFVGLDLALPPGARTTHAKASARAAEILALQDHQMEVRDETGVLKTQQLVSVPGIQGEPVFTYYSFKMYLEDLHALIAQTPVRFIDATEGGALKRGALQQTLQETLSQISPVPFSLRERLRCLPHLSPVVRFHCIQELRQRLLNLREIENEFREWQEGRLTQERGEAAWRQFLGNPDLRCLLDHAIFSLQLQPKLSRIPDAEKTDFLNHQIQDALRILKIFTVFWQDALGKVATLFSLKDEIS